MSSMSRKTFLRSLLGATAASSFAGCRPGSQAQAPAAQAPATSSAAPASAPGPTRTEKLLQRVFDNTISTYVIGAAYVGDRLGLFKAMAGAGPMTGRQLSARTKLDETYTNEWLRAMATSGYVDYHAAQGTFELPAEHVPVLVDEDSPMFVTGLLEGAIPDLIMIPRVLEAFRTGKGIPYDRYPAETFDSIERGTRPDYLHLLVQQWLPAVPGLVDRLKTAATAADLGCGAGLASISLAKAFPNVHAFGFEPYEPSVRRARENARAAGVADRATFGTFDGVHVPGGPFDLITINYALHHAGKPVELMKSARAALAPGGAFLVVEYRKSDKLEDDIDSDRRVFYGTGLLECVPTALAEGGPGYGTGIVEGEMRRLAQAAGFSDCARIVKDDPIRSLFVLRA
jgi:SAM-dependent methyltransferase